MTLFLYLGLSIFLNISDRQAMPIDELRWVAEALMTEERGTEKMLIYCTTK
jgi:hypothetical protein